MSKPRAKTSRASAKARTRPKVKFCLPADPSVASTRETLVKAGLRLFASKGFAAATVKDIAEEAQVNISLISYHFKGKEGLYRACVEQFGKERLAIMHKLMTPPTSPEDFRVRLAVVIEQIVDLHMEDPEGSCIIHRDIETELGVLGDVFENTFLKIFQAFVEFLLSAQKKGFLVANFDPHFTPGLIFSAVIHALRTAPITERYFNISYKEESGKKRLVQEAVRLFCDGLIRKAPQSKGEST